MSTLTNKIINNNPEISNHLNEIYNHINDITTIMHDNTFAEGYNTGILTTINIIQWFDVNNKKNPLIVEKVFPESKTFYALNTMHNGWNIFYFIFNDMEISFDDIVNRIVKYEGWS